MDTGDTRRLARRTGLLPRDKSTFPPENRVKENSPSREGFLEVETCKPGPVVRDNPWGHLLPSRGPSPLPRVGVSGWPRPCPRLCLTWSPGEVAATLVWRRAGHTQVHTPWCSLGPKRPLGTVIPLRVSTVRDFGRPLWALPHLPSPRPPGGIREPLLLDSLCARGLISPASRPVGPLPRLC